MAKKKFEITIWVQQDFTVIVEAKTQHAAKKTAYNKVIKKILRNPGKLIKRTQTEINKEIFI